MVRGGYEELVHAIIRPPRAEYSESVLGPTAFTVDGVIFEREDVWLRNKRDQRLACSHWKPKSLSEEGAHPKPCVIYLHGNASCRAEALETLPHILSSGMTLFAFDFAGSGHSEGEYISLGWYEREDLEAVVDHLRSTGKTSSIGLWGRSMGAATALMFAERDPSIAAMVLDSPFASLKQLAKELSSEVNVPHFLMGMALRMVRNSVRSRAHFDIFKLEPIKHAETSFIPALFGHGEEDHFILPHHSQQLYDAYAGDKNLRTFPGDHSSSRPQFFIDSVCIFLYNTLISTTEQDSDVVGHADPRNFDFALNYTMPPPMASPGARSPSASFSGAVPPGAAAGASEDVYEEAMLRHAIQLSLAEAQGTSGESTIAGAQGGVSTDELDAEFHDALQQSSFPSDNQKSDDRHQDDDDDDHEKDDDGDSATHAKNVKADEGGTTGASSNDVKLCHVSDNDGDESDIEDAALKAALEASMIESESSAIKNAGNDFCGRKPRLGTGGCKHCRDTSGSPSSASIDTAIR
ncbi:Monoacylglycerol lipase ABHD12 [Hondaea fermentalgiana]|uniref:Monoacylglycerol lipase ABHD12 n=1 Tax=Hondaea fermentalgiana TaxID=2315210 RepID=A0A2R5GAN0_9STRA|nr:Monoacylglycerol lipase ABHD12 [Hondaea fermentalgiana]|eukprot:GBG27369.1 Monoacylglycerol lipase ABHD12 [Hondaea fermentalgiana]